MAGPSEGTLFSQEGGRKKQQPARDTSWLSMCAVDGNYDVSKWLPPRFSFQRKKPKLIC